MLLKITYRTNKLKKVCTEFGQAQKEYGKNMAVKIHQRIAEISSADSIEQLVKFSIGGCHVLHGNRDGQFAMDLEQPFRLIIAKDKEKIVCAKIEEIVDYH